MCASKPKVPKPPPPPPPPPAQPEKVAQKVEGPARLRIEQRNAARLGTNQLRIPYINIP